MKKLTILSACISVIAIMSTSIFAPVTATNEASTAVTTASETTEKTYDINNEAYRNYVDSLGEKIAYEEEFVAYLNKAYTLTEDERYTHVYNAAGNENVKGINNRLYIVETIVPGTNEKARQFEKFHFYWGTSDEDEYAYGFLNYDDIFGGDYIANEINTYLEEKKLNARVVTVEKGGSPAKKVVHYDDTSEENVVATFLAINEKFGAKVCAYSTEMENLEIFYDDSILVGDADGDNELTVRDCSFIARKIAEGKATDIPNSADFNGDGEVNVRDAAAIATHLASK